MTVAPHLDDPLHNTRFLYLVKISVCSKHGNLRFFLLSASPVATMLHERNTDTHA